MRNTVSIAFVLALMLPAVAGEKVKVATVGVTIPTPKCTNAALTQHYLKSMTASTDSFKEHYREAVALLGHAKLLPFKETGAYLTWTTQMMSAVNAKLAANAPTCTLNEAIQYETDSYAATAKLIDVEADGDVTICQWLRGLGKDTDARQSALAKLPMPQIVNGDGKFGDHFSRSIDCSKVLKPAPHP